MCFVAAPGALNKAHVQFLEASLVRLARAAKRSPLDNGNTPAGPTLSEADRADMQVFLHNMLGMLPVLGVHAFEQAAAAVVLGFSANGRIEWKDARGRTLKELQAQEAVG